MKITLRRIALRQTYTIGKLYLEGVYFCDTLEDPVRTIKEDGSGKIWGDTAIPYGKYKMKLSYSPKFKRILPRLFDVPHFSGILIHRGNTAKDSHGCILVGKNTKVGMVTSSTVWEKKLIEILEESKLKEFEIEIV